MNYTEAIAYILEIPKFTTKHGVEHTRAFLQALGNPEQQTKVIHVAGTNGKGSVCAYLQSLLLAEKKTVGFFTSPHLVQMNERIRINGTPISNAYFLEVFETVYETVQKMQQEGIPHPTFFEFLFGMAMVAFQKAGVTYVILETGLGGRLDATNAVEQPILTILTSISLDHTEILGDTIEAIAAEKAGIIKEGVPLIFDGNNKKSAKVIQNFAKKMHAPYKEMSKDAYEILENDGKKIAFSRTNAYDEDSLWEINSFAEYQVQNAMLVLEAMDVLFPNASREDSHRALWRDVLSRVCWEGRMEEVLPNVIVDGAHNLGAIEAFCESVRTRTSPQGKTIVLFSAVQEKEYEKMIAYLCQHINADMYIITTITSARAVQAKELASVFQTYTEGTIIVKENVEEAFQTAIAEQGEYGQVYCLGSLYLIGQIKEIILGGTTNA